jgi:O-antigen/teichoic acid export membrane protein
MSKALFDILYVFSSSTLAKCIGACTAFVLPILLEPANYGVWITILLIISYAPIASLGTVETLLKQYPYLMGKKEFLEARNLENSILSSILISAIILFLTGILSYQLIQNSSLAPHALLVSIMFATASISMFSSFFYFRIAAHQNFKSTSLIDFVRAITTIIFLVYFSWLWQLNGTVFGYFFNEALICTISIIIGYKICGDINFTFRYRPMWSAVRIGFPITIAWWILNLQTSTDRIVSMALLGQTETGFYGLGATMYSAIILIPVAMNRVLYPRISEEVGKKADKKTILNLVLLPVRILSLVIPVFIGISIFLIPSIYYYVFPKYIPGQSSAQILLLGSFAFCLIGNGANYLIASDKQKKLVIFALVSLVTNILTAIFLVRLEFGIEGIAFSTGLSSFLLSILIWKSVLKDLGFRVLEIWLNMVYLYVPLVLLITLLTLLYAVFPKSFGTIGLHAIAYSGIFITFYLMIISLMPPYREMIIVIQKSFNERPND